MKGFLVPSVIFEELGFRYYGPIDGHDMPLLIRTFEFLKTQNEPVLLHILTKKGKGYEPALKQPDKFHGLGKYKTETGETSPTPTPTYSEIFGKTLARFAETNQKSWRSPRRCRAGPAFPISRRRIRIGISMSGLRKSTPRSSLRAGDAGTDAVPHDLFHLLSARLRHDHSRHGDPKTERQALHGPWRIKRRRRPDPSRAFRHRLSPSHPEHRAHAAEE